MNQSQLDYATRRALNIFDAWCKVSGAVVMHGSTYSEIQGCIEDAVKCGAQAASGVEEILESEKDDSFDFG